MAGRATPDASRMKKPPSRVRAKVRAARERFTFQREMRLRLMSAAVLIPLVLAVTWYGEIAFAVLVVLTGMLVLAEWLRMIGAGHLVRLKLAGWLGLTLIGYFALVEIIAVAALIALVTAAFATAVAWSARADVAVRWVSAGVLYSAVAIVALIELRKGGEGFAAVMFVFLIAWATDTFAFLVGRKVGGPRLWRAVSPSKTWSGALGGLVAALAFGAFVALTLGAPVTAATLAIAGGVAIAAQLGDLLESACKRRFRVKDAGSIIPGHGGVMDRVDGLIAAAALAAILGSSVSGDDPATGLWTLMGK